MPSAGSPPMIVRTSALTKRYGSFVALDACSLTVNEGDVFGLLGPNGAGKTTLVRTLLGYLHATSGSATVAGYDCRSQSLDVRARTTYLPGEARLFRRMNGHAVLDFFARLRRECHRDVATQIAGRLDLDCSRQVARMSTGMRQKLALAVTLATDVPLVILDEPTANLDPTARSTVLDLVREAKQAGKTIMFSSHVLSEVEAICDHVAILRAGRVVHEQSIDDLRRGHRIHARLTRAFPGVPEAFAGHLSAASTSDGAVVMETDEPLAPLLGWLATLPLDEVRVEPVGLQAVYDRFHRPG